MSSLGPNAGSSTAPWEDRRSDTGLRSDGASTVASRNGISLLGLFQIVTACGIFFAILRVSPVAAVVATIVIAPALIRTGVAAELYRKKSLGFDWRRRLVVFAQSLWLVGLTSLFAFAVFLLVCCVFGIMGLVFGFMMSYGDLSLDAAVVGAAGGMIWGIGGALLAIIWSIWTTWAPVVATDDLATGLETKESTPAAESKRSWTSRWTLMVLFLVSDVGMPQHSIAQDGQAPAQQKNSTRKIRVQPSETASRIGTAVHWRDDWQTAQNEAAKTGKPIFWYIPTIPGSFMDRRPEIDRYVMAGPFSTPQIIDLLNQRFVPIRLKPDRKLADQYQLKPFEFVEPGFLVLDSKGTEVRRIDRLVTFHAEWLFKWIADSLIENRPDFIPSPETTAFREALRDGRIDAKEAGALSNLSTDSVETLLWAGRVAFRQNRHDLARRRFEQAAQLDPDHPLAWKAAAEAEGFGPFVRGFEIVRQLPPRALEAGVHSAGSAAPSNLYDEAAIWKRSTDYLLGMQNRRGGFTDSDYDFGGTDSLPNVHTAVTALVGMALVESQHRIPEYRPEEIRQAIDRCRQYVTDSRNINPYDRDEILWAHAYRLRFLVRLHQVRKAKHDGAEEHDGANGDGEAKAIQEAVDALESIQSKRGGWYHEYANPFVTATALLALDDAARSGASVDRARIERGLASLERDRRDNGAFPYSSFQRKRPGRTIPIAAAAGRMPLCELALFRWDRSKAERLQEAIEQSFANQQYLDSALKYDDHTSNYAYGGFFFWYDMRGRAEAIVRLEPSEQKTRWEEALREQILALPELDGCFVDSHELGRCYGTAMALLSLSAIRE